MGLIIAGAVILLLILITLLWVKLSLVYDDGGAGVSVKILFFKITLLGKKEKRLRKRDFKIKIV